MSEPSQQPAHYFPVEPTPLRMRPRLQPFGTDFGNGDLDQRYFQRDALEPLYLRAKHTPTQASSPEPRARYRIARGEREDAAHRAVLAWIDALPEGDRPSITLAASGDDSDLGARYAALSDAVQEDFVVQQRDREGADRATAVYVCFPSGWRPESILGWSFQRIHEHVPDFADEDAPARSLVAAMVERGPYVRFVWTICANDTLDHHPDEGARRPFAPLAREGWLRIERQVTVPFIEEQASLFLIRTYLRAFSSLSAGERETLARALSCMPERTARYKGLADSLEHAAAALEASASEQR